MNDTELRKDEDKMKLNLKTACAAISLALVAGCMDENHNDFFKGDASRERVDRFANIQAANGARNDGMLYPHHFEAGHLNALGRQKVLLMLEDCDNCEPIVVHLVNAGEGELLAQRKASVELYLKTEEGPNKLTFHPTQNDLVRFSKTESGELEGGGESAASDTMGINLSAGATGQQ